MSTYKLTLNLNVFFEEKERTTLAETRNETNVGHDQYK